MSKADRFIDISNGRALYSGEVFSGLSFLIGGIPGAKRHSLRRLGHVYRQLFISSFKTRRTDRALWLTNRHSFNYYHWLCEVGPRIVQARELYPNAPFLLPERCEGIPYVSAILDLLDERNVEFVRAVSSVKARALTSTEQTISGGQASPSELKAFRNRLVQNNKPGCASRRIYVTRRHADTRRILNEEELIELLRAYDFEVVATEKLHLKQQIRLFASAECFLGPHGAGLANMLFMPEGSRVAELRTPACPRCFVGQAAALSHSFTEFAGVSNCRADYNADFTVDLNQIERWLEVIREK